MIISIMGLSEVNYYEPSGNSAIIRITDGGYELNKLNYQYEKELILDFYDVVPRSGLPSNWNWFTFSDGEKLIEFFKDIQGLDELVIYCHAGISRSPAVAISYGWFTNDSELVERVKNGNYVPNKWVLESMSRLIFDRQEGRKIYSDIISFYKNKIIENNIKF